MSLDQGFRACNFVLAYGSSACIASTGPALSICDSVADACLPCMYCVPEMALPWKYWLQLVVVVL